MVLHAEGGGDATGRLDLPLVALSIAEGERIDREALILGDGERRRGVESPAQQENRFGDAVTG